MKKTYFSLLLVPLLLQASFLDDDMDGVENSFDKCPNTPFTDIVDKNGCSKKSLEFSQSKGGDISLGYYYAKISDTYSQKSDSLNLIYNYADYSFLFSSSKYKINDIGSGQDDTTLGIFYNKVINNITYQIGGGVYLPTADTTDNKTDYFTKVKMIYVKDLYDISLDYEKTFMKDINTTDTNSYTISFGYSFSENFYSSLSYSSSDSIYSDGGKLNYISLYLEYYINDDFYISSTISDGKSSEASKYSYSFDIGYTF